MVQLTLPYVLRQDKLKDLLAQGAGKPVSLIITDNSTRMISVKSGSKAVSVRLHWMFLNACEEVISEVASFMKNRRRRTPLINRFIRENRHCIRRGNGRPFRGNVQGKYFNLKELFDSLNQEYFDKRVHASIEWGRRNVQRAVRKRTLGSYCRENDIIRIHPVMDRKNVPLYYIKYVIYHEMLHSALGEYSRNGRRVMHSSEFRRRERMFREYGKARAWDTRH
jgi:predicted metal-dependent hydrolase